MGLFDWMFNKNKNGDKVTVKLFETLSNTGVSFSPWKGTAFQSDIVRSAIRPKANAVGKLNPIHVRGEGSSMVINPDPSIKALFQKPNSYMTMQDLLMKVVFQREIYHNAFIYIKLDLTTGYPVELYPVPFNRAEPVEYQGELFIKFQFAVGQSATVAYKDMIHLRKDFFDNDIFGSDGVTALSNIMDVVDTTDKGIINAIKSSAIIKWIMMFKTTTRPEDQQSQIDLFVKNYLDPETSKGIAPADPKYDLKQVEEKNYVPNAIQANGFIKRIYAFFGVNEKIVNNEYNEDEWNAFYESEIEPIALQLSLGFTNSFFTARERGFGNRIIFSANRLQYASMQTKLNLMQMVDRGSLTPNEWREVLNLGPVEGGDKPIRRLDTAPVSDKNKPVKDVNEEDQNNGK